MPGYEVTVYGAGDVEPVECKTDAVFFANQDSYGLPEKLGLTDDNDNVLIIGVGTFLAAEVKKV